MLSKFERALGRSHWPTIKHQLPYVLGVVKNDTRLVLKRGAHDAMVRIAYLTLALNTRCACDTFVCVLNRNHNYTGSTFYH